MHRFWKARREIAPKLTAAALFLCTAVSLACMFPKSEIGLHGIGLFYILVYVAAAASPLVFLCACVLVFFRSRFGYGLGLAAGLMAVPWFVWTELSLMNSWIVLNSDGGAYPGAGEFGAFAKLRILSVALTVIAIACSSLRLLPSRWLVRKSPLCGRTWPAFAVGLLVLTLFSHAGSSKKPLLLA
jgi:hypothetical protein